MKDGMDHMIMKHHNGPPMVSRMTAGNHRVSIGDSIIAQEALGEISRCLLLSLVETRNRSFGSQKGEVMG